MSPLDVESLTVALREKRPLVADHSARVSRYSVCLAMQYGLRAETIDNVRLGALLHDVGKLLVPIGILTKPGRLSRRQEEELKIHPDLGVELAGRAGLSDEVCRIILHHHERFDGMGYPDRKSGTDLHWTARVVAVMNAFDRIMHPPPDQRPSTIDEAKSRIARHAGSRFCPWIVSGLLSLPASVLEPSATPEAPAYKLDGRPDAVAILAAKAWDFRNYSAGFEANC